MSCFALRMASSTLCRHIIITEWPKNRAATLFFVERSQKGKAAQELYPPRLSTVQRNPAQHDTTRLSHHEGHPDHEWRLRLGQDVHLHRRRPRDFCIAGRSGQTAPPSKLTYHRGGIFSPRTRG